MTLAGSSSGAKPPSTGYYAETVTTAAPATNDVISQGPLLAMGHLGTTAGVTPALAVGPGCVALAPIQPGTALGGPAIIRFGNFVTSESAMTEATPKVCFPFLRGTKLTIKGRYIAFSDTPLAGTFERFGLAVTASARSQNAQQSFSETETTRDDVGAVGMVVTDAEAVKRFNCAAAGDASYSDPAGGATNVDLSVGVYFEVSVTTPSTADSFNDCAVTMTINGVSVYAAEAPTSTYTATDEGGINLIGILNQDARFDRLAYKYEVAA